MSASTDLWIRRFHPAPAAAHRLVIFPHAGGSASFYFPFSKALSPDVDVLTVQYPGRQDRLAEPLIDSVTGLADALTEVVRPWMDRPVTFFGHSMGASVAYELALRLPPSRLVVSGRMAPSTWREDYIHTLDDAGVMAKTRELAGTEAEALDDPEIMAMVLPTIRNDYRAAELYRGDPRSQVDAPILAMTGDADPRTTSDEVKAWAEHTTGTLDIEVYPGGHFFLIDNVLAIGAVLLASPPGTRARPPQGDVSGT
ncbi:thioesterase II family protein [Alloactinosynnema sp. L-07]|uniref:thioesterase II family protein n=1 Tax=Alloactinosynnema sp. L-07 TaxID=1653480 RepID=UPI000ACF42FD|nr:alpha/beta fold hydrolase [Alloactinosynnema sp. L-07]